MALRETHRSETERPNAQKLASGAQKLAPCSETEPPGSETMHRPTLRNWVDRARKLAHPAQKPGSSRSETEVAALRNRHLADLAKLKGFFVYWNDNHRKEMNTMEAQSDFLPRTDIL